MISVRKLITELAKFDPDSIAFAEQWVINILKNIPNNINGERAGFIPASDAGEFGETVVYTESDTMPVVELGESTVSFQQWFSK